MRIDKRYLKQDATYWESETPDGLGSYTPDPNPILIKVRWEDARELVRTAEGHEVVSNSIVYLDREVSDSNGYLALGDYTTTGEDPKSVAYRIIKIESTPSLRGDKQIIKVII